MPEDEFHAAVRRGALPRPVPPELLPRWWSEDVVQWLGIRSDPAVAVPDQEQGTGVAVPNQEQRPSVGVLAQEQRVAVPVQERKIVVVFAATAHDEAVAASEPATPADPERADEDDDADRFARVLQRAYRTVIHKHRVPHADAIPITQARQLLAKYGFVACMRQLRTLAWRLRRGGLHAPLAYYLAALDGGYAPPPKRRPAGRMAMLRDELAALEAQRRAEEQAEREAHLRQPLQKGEVVLAVLPPSERQALAERLGTSSVPEPLLRFEMRMLALRRYGE